MQKHIGDQILKLINAIRNETGQFIAEINGPKEGASRDKMIRGLLQQANHAESMLFDRLLAAEPAAEILDPEEPGCGARLPDHLS